MYRNILFPTDGTDGARAALDHALNLAERHDATLHLLNVVSDARWSMLDDEGMAMTGVDVGEIQQNLERRAETVIDETAKTVEERGVTCVSDVVSGDSPHSAILDYAADENIDLIVMGTHGRRGFDRLLMGSVAEKVVRSSPVPVLTVKMDDPEERDRDPDQNRDRDRDRNRDRGQDRDRAPDAADD